VPHGGLGERNRSTVRLFLVYACASLVPVLALGLVLSAALRAEARARGTAEGRAHASLLARTAIEPVLDGHPLSEDLTPGELGALRQVTERAVRSGDVVRVRLRDLRGRVVFSGDGSGLRETPEGESAGAAGGATVAHLTRLNTDANDDGPAGPEVVEVYLPLSTGGPQLGVLEIYLPYAPIAHDINAGRRTLNLVLAAGLVLLWAILALVSASTMRRMAWLGDHDPLTGLPNRGLFHRRAGAAIDHVRRHGGSAAVVLADVDRFKEINDTLGHHSGDALLRELAARLATVVRPGDTVARLGGDEFGLVLTGVHEPAIPALVDRLRGAFDGEVTVSGLPVGAEASIGYAIAPADGDDADTLLRHADVALYRAKAGRIGAARYDPRHDHFDVTKLALVSELRRAVEADELVLHYQPKVNLGTGQVCSVEALVRWQHPQRGLLAPEKFLAVAEQTGLIEPLTRWVLTTALRRLGAGSDDAELSVAVNVSARNLAQPDFADMVLTALSGAGVAAERLTLEITETALLADPETAAALLTRVSAAGVRVSIDDFGQGQTSLGYLAQLPVHELKIDQKFVTGLPGNTAHAAIVRSMIDLGHNLGLRVVAEGIEDAATLALVTEFGCDVAQGYLLARPMPAGDLPGWLAAHRTTVLRGP
jgi:diguanylate cyclase (GGDEF)-like protein